MGYSIFSSSDLGKNYYINAIILIEFVLQNQHIQQLKKCFIYYLFIYC